jgi:hypothetical protein
MIKKTINERLLESIKSTTNDFEDSKLDKDILLEISKQLIDYVIEVDGGHTREDNAARSFENDLYKKFS